MTFALHMARSMDRSQSKVMNPIAASTGYHVKKISSIIFFQSSRGIDKMKRVVYEYIGIERATLGGQISPQNLIEPLCLVKRNDLLFERH